MSDTAVVISDMVFEKEPYAPPEPGSMYSVRDKQKCERVVQVVDVSEDHKQVQVQVLEHGHATTKPIPVAVEALNRQAEIGWCNRLKSVAAHDDMPESVEAHDDAPEAESPTAPSSPSPTTSPSPNAEMGLDAQHFHRCCAEIARANILFDTHIIRDIGDGHFHAGDYEEALKKFEQVAMMFSAAVANSRRAITDGRRGLAASKSKLKGKESQDRIAEYVRSEQLINIAARDVTTILEGLRQCVQAQQAKASTPVTQSESALSADDQRTDG